MPAWSLKRAAAAADWFLKRLATARALRPDIGLAFDTIIGDDFGQTVTSELTDIVGVADASASEQESAGVVEVSVGDDAVSPSSARYSPSGAGSHVKLLTTTPWYMAALVKITQPLDATQLADTRADAVCLFGDENNFVSIGIRGIGSGGSVTKWVGAVDSDSSVITVLGPTLDGEESAVWHLFESWIDVDGDVHFSIDSQEFDDTIDAANVPAIPAKLGPVINRQDVGDPAIVNFDKYCVIVPSPTVGEL